MPYRRVAVGLGGRWRGHDRGHARHRPNNLPIARSDTRDDYDASGGDWSSGSIAGWSRCLSSFGLCARQPASSDEATFSLRSPGLECSGGSVRPPVSPRRRTTETPHRPAEHRRASLRRASATPRGRYSGSRLAQREVSACRRIRGRYRRSRRRADRVALLAAQLAGALDGIWAWQR